MHRAAVARQIEAIAFGLRKFQHAHEHRWHSLAMGDATLFDQSERMERVKLLHHHDRSALDQGSDHVKFNVVTN